MAANPAAPAPAGHTRRLAAFIAAARYEDLSGEVVSETKRFLIDTIGCIIAARRTAIGPIVADAARLLSGGARHHELAAAYEYGRLANALDLEEGVPSGTHFGCAAAGAALALSPGRRVSGPAFLTALAVGYEAGGRIGDAIGPYFRTDNGFARSFANVWGAMTPVVFAAAAAAANLLRHDAGLTVETLGLAGSNAPLPIGAKWSAETRPPNTKYGDTGWCTLTGVFAARAAACGSTAISTILDEPDALYQMVAAPNAQPAIVSSDLGSRWRILDILYKKWPCCRWIHYALTALDAIKRDAAIDVAAIDRVVVRVGVAATSERFRAKHPQTFAGCQFSIPHAVAMLLLDVPPGPDWFDQGLIGSQAACALRERVDVEIHDKQWQFPDFRLSRDAPPRRLPALVEIHAGGRILARESAFAYGDSYCPEMRWGDEEVFAKFRALAGPAHAGEIIDIVTGIERLEDVRTLLELVDGAV